MKQIALVILMSFLFLSTSNAQSTYSRVFDISEDAGESGFQILLYNGQYYILVGLRDIFTFEDYAGILVIDSLGEMILSNTLYEGVQSADPTGPEAMIIVNNKIYIAATYLNSTNNFDLMLLNLDIEDNQTWQIGYDSPLNEYATSLKMGEDTTLILLGDQKHESGSNSYYAVLLKTNLEGIELSRQIINTDFPIFTRELQILSDSSLLIGGVACLPDSPSCFSQKSAVILKMSRSGEILWTHFMPETESPTRSFQVIELDNGRLAASWYRDTFPPGGVTYYYPCTIYFLDSLGNQEYYVPFDAPYDKQIVNLRLLSNGDILGIGTTNDFPDYNTEGGWLFRMTQQGELIWEQKIMDYRFESGFGWFNDAVETPDGGIIAVGFMENIPAQSVDTWVIKLTADGCFLDTYDDCTDDLLMITPVENTIPIQESISIFPNPAHDVIRVVLNIEQGSEMVIKIFDVFGKLVFTTLTNT